MDFHKVINNLHAQIFRREVFYIQHDCKLVPVRPHLKGTLLAIKTQALHTKAAPTSKANILTVLSNGATGQADSQPASLRRSLPPQGRVRPQGLWGSLQHSFFCPGQMHLFLTLFFCRAPFWLHFEIWQMHWALVPTSKRGLKLTLHDSMCFVLSAI